MATSAAMALGMLSQAKLGFLWSVYTVETIGGGGGRPLALLLLAPQIMKCEVHVKDFLVHKVKLSGVRERPWRLVKSGNLVN